MIAPPEGRRFPSMLRPPNLAEISIPCRQLIFKKERDYDTARFEESRIIFQGRITYEFIQPTNHTQSKYPLKGVFQHVYHRLHKKIL